MSNDRRTKAQILEELAAAKERLATAEARPVAPKPQPVPVADAIASCIRALDAIKGRNDYLSNMSNRGDLENILHMLCDRYGVTRVERVTEPCTRTHAEDLTASSILDLVKNGMEMYPHV